MAREAAVGIKGLRSNPTIKQPRQKTLFHIRPTACQPRYRVERPSERNDDHYVAEQHRQNLLQNVVAELGKRPKDVSQLTTAERRELGVE